MDASSKASVFRGGAAWSVPNYGTFFLLVSPGHATAGSGVSKIPFSASQQSISTSGASPAAIVPPNAVSSDRPSAAGANHLPASLLWQVRPGGSVRPFVRRPPGAPSRSGARTTVLASDPAVLGETPHPQNTTRGESASKRPPALPAAAALPVATRTGGGPPYCPWEYPLPPIAGPPACAKASAGRPATKPGDETGLAGKAENCSSGRSATVRRAEEASPAPG